MKKPPSQVAPSQCRIAARQQKDTAHTHEHKLDQLKEMLPSYLERYHADRITSRSENRFKLHCPFHEDKTPSFVADDSKGTWLFDCFSCGLAGSVIDLHAKTVGVDPRTFAAIRETANSLGFQLDRSAPFSPGERREWTRTRKEAKRQALVRTKAKEDQQKLTAYQQKTLLQKLDPYLSTDWRADLYDSSPIWNETPDESILTFLSILFPPEAILWMGEPYETGKEKHRENFKSCREWLAMDSLPSRIAAGHFRPGSISRSKENLEMSSFAIIESDDLIGHKPTDAGERAQNKALSYALAGYCQQELGLHLRAVIDTGNKSLHLWFDRPPPRAMAAVRTLAPGLRIDTGLLDSCATAPLRMPGCLHEKTHLPAILLYLDHAAS